MGAAKEYQIIFPTLEEEYVAIEGGIPIDEDRGIMIEREHDNEEDGGNVSHTHEGDPFIAIISCMTFIPYHW